VLEVQLTDAAAKINPEILIVYHTKLFAALLKKHIAIFVKSRDAEASHAGAAQLVLNPLPHFLGRIFGVGNGQDFIRPRVPFADETGNAPGENGGFSGAGAGDDQQRPVDVFDSFALALVRLERPGT
jgi:hypothetical protein